MTQQAYPGRSGDLTYEEAHRLFTYKDGCLYWKVSGNRRRVGMIAGTRTGDGYISIKINYRLHRAHRIIWVMHQKEPAAFIDHIDGDQLNNRIENLRAATHAQNCRNRRVRHDSKSGVKGVTRKKGKWYTCVILDGKRYSAGYFVDKEDAIAAVDKLRKELHGEFARS